MSAPLRRTGLFQAIVKGIADEWYRKIMDSAAVNREPVKRISPQYYIFDTSTMPNGEALQLDQSLKDFVVTGPLRMDQPTIYPALRYTNHVSGNWFAIRSLEDPGLYWSHDPSNGKVVVSRIKRTYFQIWIVEPAKPAGTIMIDTDQVRMSASHDSNQSISKEGGGLQFLNINPGGGRQDLQFNFSGFRNRFGSYQGDQVFYDPGSSEEWELV